MEEIEKTEEEITEEFLKEYTELRKKYGRDFSVEVRLTPEKVNIPK
jgi:uncharacterized protein YnzC (UPF0291/DUF896 family)